MYWFFSLTLFVSAFLLFWVQPMIAKMILPLLGGTPAVWTTCILFFQIMLLAGYLYAHLLSTRLRPRLQAPFHLLLLAGGALFLPFRLPPGIATTVPWAGNIEFWLLILLFRLLAVPFFVISASSSLLQRWFSRTDHPAGNDPYFLYVASNLGSLLALLAYPVLMEPTWTLTGQNRLWAFLYWVLVAGFVACGFFLWRRDQSRSVANLGAAAPVCGQGISARPSAALRLRWLLLAFIPSSLMLGVTSYLTTDIASFPLLWIVPLALYLLTFIVSFARHRIIAPLLLEKMLPITTLVLAFMMLTEIKNPLWLIFIFYLLFFTVAALVCHGRLARSRPDSAHLTEFYLFLALGGALGGIFNGLLAPLLFNRILEFPLLLAFSCLVLLDKKSVPHTRRDWLRELFPPLLLGGLTAVLAVLVPRFTLESYRLWMLIIFGVPLIAAYTFVRRPVRFTMGLAAILLGGSFYSAVDGRVLLRERNFFGAFRITYDSHGPYYRFYHGSTLHGMQFVSGSQRDEPLAYFHRLGPLGEIMETYNAHPVNDAVAAVGLGIGNVLAYARPGQNWTFYEIDPAIVRIARQSSFFSFWRDARAASVQAVVGDARIRLQDKQGGPYGLVLIDAFNSDVVPTHLLTVQAFRVYLAKLAPGGWIVLHVSSWNLNLAPVIADVAGALNLICLNNRDDRLLPENQLTRGKYPSNWIVLARTADDLDGLLYKPQWRILAAEMERPPWTDDYSNILQILNWF